MKITTENLALFNASLRHDSPIDIISFALELAERPILTSSFGGYSAALLFAVTQVDPSIRVIWNDTGYNTPATYAHVTNLQKRLKLYLEIVTPKYTTAYLDHLFGRPDLNSQDHARFSEIVKLEPFRNAIANIEPDLWFTNLRKGQTEHRDGLGILSFSENGILKVSPFYHYTNKELFEYILKHDLPVEFDYYDPVKVLSGRECGIHL